MGFIDLVSKRESCREYSDAPVSREMMEQVLEAARLAPSACNIQPWRFVAVMDKAIVPQTAKCLQSMGMNRFTDTVPAFIVISEDAGSISETAAAVISGKRYAATDIGIAAAHIALAAKTLGLDTCIIGWFNENKLRELLEIPPHHRVRLVIAIGHSATPNLPPREKRRKSLDDIARFI